MGSFRPCCLVLTPLAAMMGSEALAVPTAVPRIVATNGTHQLLVGSNVRLWLGLASVAKGKQGMMARVEEGNYGTDGAWHMTRVLNGDQTDYGLNFPSEPVLLRIKMGSWK